MRLGERQKLIVVKKVEFGVYLAERMEDETRVLLPEKQVPEGTKIGDELRVFLYKDSKDRLIATTNTPKLTLGGLAVLTVKEVGKIGAFLDWGLEKDLFLPYKEMTMKVQPEDEVLVTLYIDKSSRLCASMKKLYDLLSTDSPYKEGDHVEGRVYEFSDNFGTFVAVDDKYSAMIPRHEDTSKLRIGDVIEAKVTKVKPDGKLDVSLRDKAYLQMDEDAAKVMQVIEEFAGVLPFGDKASPEVIKRETGLSKNAFKRAVGRLYKEHRVEITERSISTEKAPAAIGPYSQAIEVNGMVYTSGIIPVVPETGEIPEGSVAQAKQALTNLSNLLEAAGTNMDNVVKTTVFIKEMNDFSAINDVYKTFFTADFPSRSCVEVARLPKDVMLEIEAIAIK